MQILHEDEARTPPRPRAQRLPRRPHQRRRRSIADAWDASLVSRCPNTSAESTPPITLPVSRVFACGTNTTRTRSSSSPSTSTTSPGTPSAPSGWTAVPHPPEYALHTSMGFSTGKWEGDALAVYTTHLKEGWIRRNGLPRSYRATFTEHFIRHRRQPNAHDGDPRSRLSTPTPWFEPVTTSMKSAVRSHPTPAKALEELIRPKGKIPHHLPGTDHIPRRVSGYLPEFHPKPRAGRRNTIYPEYQDKIRAGRSGDQGGREVKSSNSLPCAFGWLPATWPPPKPRTMPKFMFGRCRATST